MIHGPSILLTYHGQLLWVTRSCRLPVTYGSLEAVDCHIHSVRYDMAVNRGASSRLRWLRQVTYDVVATPIRRTNA
eukprot:scaffold33559_cov129-Skeletonema_dohrnii-CCMP3373.AAC.2